MLISDNIDVKSRDGPLLHFLAKTFFLNYYLIIFVSFLCFLLSDFDRFQNWEMFSRLFGSNLAYVHSAF